MLRFTLTLLFLTLLLAVTACSKTPQKVVVPDDQPQTMPDTPTATDQE